MLFVLRFLTIVAICSLLVLPAGCGKKEEEQQTAAPSPTPSAAQNDVASSESPAPAPQPSATPAASPSPTTAPDYNVMAAQNAETLKAMNQGQDIQPLGPETLKGFLPDTLATMKRTDIDARQMAMMGINVASGRAAYADADSGQLDLMITDLGNVSAPMRMAMAGWAVTQVDTQTDTGYEKTVTYQGHEAYEQYDRGDSSGSFRVFAGDRFVVEVSGTDVTMVTIKQAMGQVDLKKLLEAAK
ncbi:MAG: hypothetical protein JSW27_11520 [Phycisphaerales bacterium]|nr:MAG: hypothetical protein JSW27_11520 [Phycisphaerales bacterium]